MAACYTFNLEKFRKDAADAAPAVKATIHRYSPNCLYRLKNTNRRVTIGMYRGDGSVDVRLEVMFNIGLHPELDGYVIHLDPEALEVCRLPKEYKNPPGWNWVDQH